MDTLEIEKTDVIKETKKKKVSTDSATQYYELIKKAEDLKKKRIQEIGLLADKIGVLFYDIDELAGALLLLKNSSDTSRNFNSEKQEYMKNVRSLGENFRKSPNKSI